MDRIQGFDVSHHQNTITWTDIPAAEVKFCFIKATDGAHGKDKNFEANWDGAQSVGIIRGAYHFFRPHSLVAEQVSSFLTQVGALDLNDLPPVLDLEIP